jgi:hypothetical protein
MTLDQDIQLMHELDALTPNSLPAFEHLHESERKQVIRGMALDAIRESAADSGIPLRRDFADSLDMSGAVELARTMRPPERTTDPLQAMRESGIPMRVGEASAGLSDGALARDDDPPHVIAADLADTVPDGHSDRPLVDELHAKGAALSSSDKTQIKALAARHLQSGDAAVAESMSLLREAGISLTSGSGSSPAEPRQFTPQAALRATGIPLRPDPTTAGGIR